MPNLYGGQNCGNRIKNTSNTWVEKIIKYNISLYSLSSYSSLNSIRTSTCSATTKSTFIMFVGTDKHRRFFIPLDLLCNYLSQRFIHDVGAIATAWMKCKVNFNSFTTRQKLSASVTVMISFNIHFQYLDIVE